MSRNVRAMNVTPASSSPPTTSGIATRESGRQAGSGATSNLTSTSPASSALSSRICWSRTRSRSTTWRMTGRALTEGWCLRRLASSSLTATAATEPLEAFLGDIALGDQPFGLARLLEERAPLSEGRLDLRPVLPGRRHRVPVPLELPQCEVALLHGRLGARNPVLDDLQAPGILVASAVELLERPLEPPLDERRCHDPRR